MLLNKYTTHPFVVGLHTPGLGKVVDTTMLTVFSLLLLLRLMLLNWPSIGHGVGLNLVERLSVTSVPLRNLRVNLRGKVLNCSLVA